MRKNPTPPEPKLTEQKLREEITALRTTLADRENSLRIIRNALAKLTGGITSALGE